MGRSAASADDRPDGRLERALVAFVSQEFSAPTAAIVGFAEILLEDARRHGLADFVPDLEVFFVLEFALRDGPLGFVADIDEHFVLVNADDRAVHDLPFVDLGEGGLVVGNELPVGACDPDAGLFMLDEFVSSQSGRQV